MSGGRPAFVVTGADLAPQALALALLRDDEIVYAGKAPTEDDIVALCRRPDPVAIIVRYGKVGVTAMDAAPALKVISKHDSGTDTIDTAAATTRGIRVVAAAGAISLHCPLTSDNARLLNEQTLAACKKRVIVVNTARGGLIDEAALLDAIRRGHVTSAGLDSFAVEPMSATHPFHGEARITLSPHVGGATADAYVKMGVSAARNALDVLNG